MTVEQAYTEGFCKAAEAAGVDSQALMKCAAIPKQYMLNNLIKTVMGAGSRISSVANPSMLSRLRRIVKADGKFANKARAALVDNAHTALAERIEEIKRARNILELSFPQGIPQQYTTKLDQIRRALGGHVDRIKKFNPGTDYHPGRYASDRAAGLLAKIDPLTH